MAGSEGRGAYAQRLKWQHLQHADTVRVHVEKYACMYMEWIPVLHSVQFRYGRKVAQVLAGENHLRQSSLTAHVKCVALNCRGPSGLACEFTLAAGSSVAQASAAHSRVRDAETFGGAALAGGAAG